MTAPAGGRSRRSLSLVVPAWNEAEGIDRMIDACIACAEETVRDRVVSSAEIVIVDDGSSDGTGDRIAVRAASDPRIVPVRHPSNRGLGAAITSGIGAATGDLVLYTDADLPVDLAHVGPAVANLQSTGADMVVGCRPARSGDGALRRVYTLGYDALIRLAFAVPVYDVNFAFKLFERERVASLDLRSRGSFIDAEMLARLVRSGGTVVRLELRYDPRRWGTSSLGGRAAIVSILKELSQQYWDIRRIRPAAPAAAAG